MRDMDRERGGNRGVVITPRDKDRGGYHPHKDRERDRRLLGGGEGIGIGERG